MTQILDISFILLIAFEEAERLRSIILAFKTVVIVGVEKMLLQERYYQMISVIQNVNMTINKNVEEHQIKAWSTESFTKTRKRKLP